jgi:hypothetical protein
MYGKDQKYIKFLTGNPEGNMHFRRSSQDNIKICVCGRDSSGLKQWLMLGLCEPGFS